MAVTRTDKEFQPIDALARALESGYELKLDGRLREHLEDWLQLEIGGQSRHQSGVVFFIDPISFRAQWRTTFPGYLC